MENYLKAFKAYDIRGIYGQEIDEKLAYALGKGIGTYMQNTYGKNAKLLIGTDPRENNTTLIQSFIVGLHQVGFENVVYACFDISKKFPYGVCSTPALYYLGQNDFDLSVAFTASHNPPEYVGMKFFDKHTTFLSQQFLKHLFQKHYDAEEIMPETHVSFPDCIDVLIQEKYDKLSTFLENKLSSLSQTSFAVDFSNGAAVTCENSILKKTDHIIYFLNETPDGSFPNHLSETQDHENYQQLIDEVQKHNLMLGMMFDGDADRVGFVGNDGKVVGGDIVLAIIAKQILQEEIDLPMDQKIILYEVMCSKIIPEVVQESGGQYLLTRMGRFFIKEKMEEVGALFAGETSGHFMFKSIGNYEMPLLALYYVLKELENYSNRDAMMQAYKRHYKSPVYSALVQDKELVIQRIKETFANCDQKHIDGISVFGDDFWFNTRPSNTEPKMRFTVEADTSQKMEEVLEKLRRIIR